MARSYAIIGTGALGGYYGGMLARAGLDVHFLCHSDAQHVKQHGLRVDRPERFGGGFTLPSVHAYGDPCEMPACDVVCLCVKTTQTAEVLDALPALLTSGGGTSGGGVVLVLQNGYSPERAVVERVGADRVLGGLCFLCSNKVGPGHVSFLDYGQIKLAPGIKPAQSSALWDHAQSVTGDFSAAGIPIEVSEDLVLARWQKLVWNVPFNGLSAMLGLTTDVMMSDPAILQQVTTLMQEVQRAALAADGRTITPAFIEKMLDNTRRMRPYKTSMLLDKENGRPVEVEAILGDPLRAGESAGAELPAMRQVYEALAAARGKPRG
jgi:2-dehydropantoate 2-reductase